MEPEPVQITQDTIEAPLLPQEKNRWLVPAALFAALILIAGALYFFINSTVALRGLHVLKVGDTGASLQVFGFNGLKEVAVPTEGNVIDYASSATTKAFLVVDAELKASVVLAGSEPKVLYRGVGDLARLVVSEDGTMVAVAELDPARKDSDFTSIDAWTVHVFDASGTKLMSTPGYAPSFFTSEGATFLMVTAPTGITIVDPANRSSATQPVLDSAHITRTATVSPDGKYLAIPNALVESYTLYEVTSLAPLRFAPLWDLEPKLSSVVWDKETLYGVSREKGAGESSKLYSFQTSAESAGTLRYTFPLTSAHYRITP